jgi:hypothetical protein
LASSWVVRSLPALVPKLCHMDSCFEDLSPPTEV